MEGQWLTDCNIEAETTVGTVKGRSAAEGTVPKNTPAAKRRRKSAAEKSSVETSSSMSQHFTATTEHTRQLSAVTSDDDTAFGNLVGLELKSIADPVQKMQLKKEIMHSIYDMKIRNSSRR